MVRVVGGEGCEGGEDGEGCEGGGDGDVTGWTGQAGKSYAASYLVSFIFEFEILFKCMTWLIWSWDDDGAAT